MLITAEMAAAAKESWTVCTVLSSIFCLVSMVQLRQMCWISCVIPNEIFLQNEYTFVGFDGFYYSPISWSLFFPSAIMIATMRLACINLTIMCFIKEYGFKSLHLWCALIFVESSNEKITQRTKKVWRTWCDAWTCSE